MLPQRRRSGCLGQLILLGLLLTVLGIGVMAITSPWIFTVGGHLRLLPSWEGVGAVQGPGGTYRIFVSFQPSRGGSRILPSTSVSGTGWICAPAGHSYKIRVGGGAHEVVWRDMNNKDFTLYTWQRHAWSTQHLPPKLDFAGRWVGPNLVMDDKGSTAAAFLSDGTPNPRPGARGPKQPVTFVETSWWLGSPCVTGAATSGHAN
jgi:hypothetical protein